jgi:hypothetical protein
MNENRDRTPRPLSRREFFRSAGRKAAGGALAAVAAVLAWRGLAGSGANRKEFLSCHASKACPGCTTYGSCRLPRAEAYRRFEARKKS